MIRLPWTSRGMLHAGTVPHDYVQPEEGKIMTQPQGEWVIANIYSGDVADDTTRYASMDAAGQALMDLVQQGRLKEGDWEVRPAPRTGMTAPEYTPNDV